MEYFQIERAQGPVGRAAQSKGSFNATLREEGSVSLSATVSPGKSCAETPTSRCSGLRRDKARAPIAEAPSSVHCTKKQEKCAAMELVGPCGAKG
jgi:hypothetical protein